MINPFQLIVDATQKQPHQICHLLAKPLILALLLMLYFDTSKWAIRIFAAVLNISWTFTTYMATKHPAVNYAVLGSRRWFTWCITVIAAWCVYMVCTEPTAMLASATFFMVLMTLIYWFAGCRPPKPPSLKHNFRPVFGAF